MHNVTLSNKVYEGRHIQYLFSIQIRGRLWSFTKVSPGQTRMLNRTRDLSVPSFHDISSPPKCSFLPIDSLTRQQKVIRPENQSKEQKLIPGNLSPEPYAANCSFFYLPVPRPRRCQGRTGARKHYRKQPARYAPLLGFTRQSEMLNTTTFRLGLEVQATTGVIWTITGASGRSTDAGLSLASIWEGRWNVLLCWSDHHHTELKSNFVLSNPILSLLSYHEANFLLCSALLRSQQKHSTHLLDPYSHSQVLGSLSSSVLVVNCSLLIIS